MCLSSLTTSPAMHRPSQPGTRQPEPQRELCLSISLCTMASPPGYIATRLRILYRAFAVSITNPSPLLWRHSNFPANFLSLDVRCDISLLAPFYFSRQSYPRDLALLCFFPPFISTVGVDGMFPSAFR